MIYRLMTGGRISTEPIEVKTAGHEKLLGFQSIVDPDGRTATFKVEVSNIPSFSLRCPVEDMPLFYSEVQHTSDLMFSRIHQAPDRGASVIMEMAERALHPVSVDVLIDPRNGDRIFIQHFKDRAPFVSRLTAHEYRLVQMKEATALAHKIN